MSQSVPIGKGVSRGKGSDGEVMQRAQWTQLNTAAASLKHPCEAQLCVCMLTCCSSISGRGELVEVVAQQQHCVEDQPANQAQGVKSMSNTTRARHDTAQQQSVTRGVSVTRGSCL